MKYRRGPSANGTNCPLRLLAYIVVPDAPAQAQRKARSSWLSANDLARQGPLRRSSPHPADGVCCPLLAAFALIASATGNHGSVRTSPGPPLLKWIM